MNVETNKIVASLLGEEWSAIVEVGENADIQTRSQKIEHSSGARISIYHDSYRKKFSISCQWPKYSKSRSYGRKSDFDYSVPDTKTFDDSIGCADTALPERIASNISTRLLKKGFIDLYAKCQAVVDESNVKQKAIEEVAQRLGKETGTWGESSHGDTRRRFDTPYNSNLVDISGTVNYDHDVDIEIKGLTEQQTRLVIQLVHSFDKQS